MVKQTTLAALLSLHLGTGLMAAEIQIVRRPNCNLINADEAAFFEATLKGFPPGPGKAKAVVTDYHGAAKTVDLAWPAVAAGQPAALPVDLGVLELGYYELQVQAEGGGVTTSSKMMSFGVVPLVDRTAEEARKRGCRFGLKTFSVGGEGLWWRKGEVWNLPEVVDACASLGLQWTRHQFNQPASANPGTIGTNDLITKHSMNVVLKVEGFPEECYDAARYGSLEDWKAKKKNKAWSRCTVPLKEPYQKWLKEEIAKLPASQNIFEIGNEVWNYMPAEEFAEWCRMSVEAIKQARPDAKVGADPGVQEYGRKFLAAGGMDGMEIWYDHPYSFTPLPEHRIRGFLRNYRDILKRRTGRDFELYVTEYGWPIAPNDSRKHSVSEKVQAQRTTRESLMLYAEDAKTLIPHWMGDREQDPTEREHWFGFFRLNQQPLPVVIAHATCARMIDGGKFVGDLWQGPGIGAMLFERAGVYTLAVWTAEEDKRAEITVGVPEIKVVDLMGAEKKEAAPGGKISLPLNGDVVYLVGVSPDLAAKAAAPGADLNPDLWSKRDGSFAVSWAAGPMQIDGILQEWAGATPIAFKPGPASGGAAGLARLKWDPEHVYAAFEISGLKPGSKEEFEFGLGVRPDRQVDMGATAIYDFAFKLKRIPGKETLTVGNADFDKDLAVEPQDPSGIRWAIKSGEQGWTAEMEIPVKFLKGMPPPASGLKLSGRWLLKDAENKKVLLGLGDEKARLWPYLALQEKK
jgi:hypothetical protein